MASGDNSQKAPGKPRGRPWQKGQTGNAGGLSKHVRAVRASVREALDKAFTVGDRDTLIEAIVEGVATKDSTCLKLACEYRWGKAPQPLTGENGQGPVNVASMIHVYLPDNGRGTKTP